MHIVYGAILLRRLSSRAHRRWKKTIGWVSLTAMKKKKEKSKGKPNHLFHLTWEW